jgi:hypothetical protein
MLAQYSKIVIALVLSFLGFTPSCTKLTCISVSGMDEWQEIEAYEATQTVYRALLAAPSYRIRVEKRAKLAPEDAKLLLNVDVMQITGLFDDARSPYPGMVSDRIRCDDRLKPKIETIHNESLEVTYFRAGLNNRLQYGTCIENELPYKSYNALFYCEKEKALYQLEFITDRQKASDATYRDLATSIRCLVR